MTLNKLIEKAIKHGACEHVINQLKKYETFEEAIQNENAPFWCYWYAINVIKRRWKKGESVILTSPSYCYYYAYYILKQRWEDCERVILTSPLYSYLYACYILKQRWEQAEPIIFTLYKQSYCKYFDINE